MNILRYVAFRQLQSRPLRTVLTVLGVAFGLALWVAIKAINKSTLHSFRASIEAVAGKAALTVSGGEGGFTEDVIAAIAKTPGVAHAVPMIVTRGHFAAKGPEARTLMILGVDLLKEQAVRTYKTSDEEMIEDPLVFLNQPDSIILTRAFARENGLKIDSTFELATASGKKRFTVRGLLSPEGPAKAYGGALAIMDIDGARLTFGKEGKVDRVDVVTREGEDVQIVIDRLKTALGPSLDVLRPESQSAEMENLVKSFQVMLEFFSTLSLLVGLFMVFNSVSIAVAERRREIGTLRALGATRARVLTIFLCEAAFVGFLGSLLGAWLGKIMSARLVTGVIKSMASQFVMQVEMPKLEFGLGEVAAALGVGVAASVLAALWPAFKATRVGPLEAIAQDGVAFSENTGRFSWMSPTTIAGLALLAATGAFTFMPKDIGMPTLETLNLIFSVLGAAMVAPAFVGILTSLLKLLLGKPQAAAAAAAVARLSMDNLQRNPRRTASNVAILMVGLSFVILVSVVNVSFLGTIMEFLNRILTADLLVSSNGSLISFDVQPIHENLAREIGAIPGIKKGPEFTVYGQRYLRFKHKGELIALKAYDETDPAIKYSTINALDRTPEEAGLALYHSPDPVIAVSESFVHTFGQRTGDRVELVTPTGMVSFRVIAVVGDYASPKGVVYINRKTYKKFWKDPLVSVFGLKVEPGVHPEDVRHAIDQRLGAKYNLLVTSSAEVRKQMVEKVNESFGFLHAVEGAALLVALLGILNTLMVSIMERTRELGLLRAVGMSKGQMFLLVMQESLVLGFLGAIVAITLGSWIAYAWMTRSLSEVLGWIVHFHYPWRAIGKTMAIGVGVALLAGVLPSRRAARIEIKEALEYE